MKNVFQLGWNLWSTEVQTIRAPFIEVLKSEYDVPVCLTVGW